MDHAESTAKKVIELLRPGSRMEFNRNQSQGEHDFDLFSEGRRIAIVEVTNSTKPEKIVTRNRIREPKYGGPFVTATLCLNGWSVQPSEGSDIRRIRKHVDKYLADIESTGMNHFSAFSEAAECDAVYRIYRDLGIEWGTITNWKPPRNRIAIGYPSDGGKIEIHLLLNAIRHEAEKPDNRRKLAQTEPDIERHLFVHVDPINYLPWKILVDESPEGLVADFPDEVTHVWAATETRSANNVAVWRAANRGVWRRTQIAGLSY